ncbi:unnamed protein product [Brassicogethes aeneus]|uniref:Ig-like domain-containing protein n=1 Tax=Brassicogethes aeneus TaxID=1431903 RepID=A0A9P0BDB0_BRAAE|nr:unnamed protein product [Brassicogethes aeneus]
MARLMRLLLLSIFVISTKSEDDWTKKCNRCKCIWASGRKTADCTSIGFYEIPTNLSSDIREIDFSNNPLGQFGKNVFKNAHLTDIHKLKFQNCSIQNLHGEAFNGLLLLIELDLSRNELSTLDKNIFSENIKLRVINFSYNKIKVIESGLFYNMTYAQKISLDHNEIETLEKNTFRYLPALQHISLDNNKLKSLSLDFETMPKLNSLSLKSNAWICDCHLQKFRNHVKINNLDTEAVSCEGPEKYKGRQWGEDIVFACSPYILEPTPNMVVKVEDSNVTLFCKVTGNPPPDVDWIGTNGRTLDRDPRITKQKYVVSKSTSGEYTYNNLTITNFNYRDRGEYKCLAKNPGGEDEINITLSYPVGHNSLNQPLGINMGLIIGLSVVILVTLIIIVVILVFFCKRNSANAANQKRNDDSDGLEEYIGMRDHQPDMKKQLITDVNPVSKPPRVTVPGSVTSGGTEVSDQKRILMDTDSVYDDDSYHEGSLMPLMRKSQLILDDFRQPYPPDLLSFPSRALQPSPAGSSASTVADTSRLPPHQGPQSPLYGHISPNENLYRTLPISRSQSPFVSGVPPRIPRLGQGYVTIPRRPRQSWSSEPPLSDIGEPLYDNLGLRTSINGSYANSLNKMGGDTSTPKSNRLFPSSPSTIDPIAEHESTPTAQTLPRNFNKLTPSRTNWAKANAEALRSPEKRKSTTSLPGTEGKKVPPRPPPKPKKQSPSRPLFEDEGEDGTEV